MKRKKRIENGYTLIELLAVVVVLSLIISLVVYVCISVIDNIRKKGYETNINNIEEIASSYLSENNDRLFYLTKNGVSDIEYQCITVQNLIDMGYFDNDVVGVDITDDISVNEEDYIYVERKISTKAIVKNDLIAKYSGDKYNEYSTICGRAVIAEGDIKFDVSQPNECTLSKEVNVIYTLKNLNDYNKLVNYSYKLDDESYGWTDISNSLKNERTIIVDSNRNVTAGIYNNNDVIHSGSVEIKNIDRVSPVITANDLTKVYGKKFDLFEGVNATDDCSGVVSLKAYLGNTEITSYSSLSVGVNTVTYKAKDKLGNESSKSRKITLVVAEKEFPYMEIEQSYQIPASGIYVIEAYGAQGGNAGGKGGYVKAEAYLNAGTTIYVHTGGVNGYNGGGAYGVSGYIPGGGATTFKYNGTNIVIAAGGGAQGPSGTGGAGGSGDGAGGKYSGSNGGGGSNSLTTTSTRSCYCEACYSCTKYEWYCSGYHNPVDDECHGGYARRCVSEKKYYCNCKTCTDYHYGVSGNGGSNKVVSPATTVSNTSGSRTGNGYLKLSYKIG